MEMNDSSCGWKRRKYARASQLSSTLNTHEIYTKVMKEINKEKWQLDQENEVTAATLKIRKREKIKNPEITC